MKFIFEETGGADWRACGFPTPNPNLPDTEHKRIGKAEVVHE